MKNDDIVCTCRNSITGEWFLVRGKCKDLFDEQDYVVIVRGGKDEYVLKHLFDSFENVSYKQFKQFNSYMGR